MTHSSHGTLKQLFLLPYVDSLIDFAVVVVID